MVLSDSASCLSEQGDRKMKDLTQQRLQEVLSYDPTTGVFVWLKTASNRVQVGSRAGVVATNGRRYISVDSEKYLAHRLAWLYVHGEWPKGDLKQKNGDLNDCSIANLEDVQRTEAVRRYGKLSTNSSGYRGVSPTKNGRWQASITRNYQQVSLGTFITPEEASAAYEAAASTLETAISEDDRRISAENVSRRRRLRVAWAKLQRLGVGTEWQTFDGFIDSVGDVPGRHSVVAVDPSKPIGPLNFKCEPDLSTGFDLRTREGRVAFNRAHRQQNPDTYRDRELRKNFGISLVEYREKLAQQNGVCAICGSDEVAERNGKPLALAVDHDHNSGDVRGILCIACNTGIGKLKDSPSLLRAAADYLEQHGKTDSTFVPRNPDRDWLNVASPGFGALGYG